MRAKSRVAMVLLTLAGLVWFPVVARLQVAWRLDPELLHGWLVPWFALYAAAGRWTDQTEDALRSPGSTAKWGWGAYVGGLAGVLFAIPVLAANPLWPTLQWFAAGAAAIATLGALWAVAGRAGLRVGSFGLFFLHTALIWPAALRAPVMAFLMHSNAEIAAEVLSWLGQAAVVRGNVIEVQSGLIGVEEACSGLRSLQAVWMLGWLMGEVQGLAWRRRIQLVALALLVAWTGNVARTLVLAWVVARSGANAAAAWHDPAGLAVLGLTLGVIWWVGQRMATSAGSENDTPAVETVDAVGGTTVDRPGAGARRAMILAGCAVALGEVATAWWYHGGEATAPARHWHLVESVPGWRPEPVVEQVKSVLGCSGADQQAWSEGRFNEGALALAIRWERDPTNLAGGLRGHDPTICMPAIGGRLERVLEPVTVAVGGAELIFAGYVFVTNGQTQYVFNAGWNARSNEPLVVAHGGARQIRAERLERVRRRELVGDFDRLVLVRQGTESETAAIAWLRHTAVTLLTR